jgi:hypothetical protein
VFRYRDAHAEIRRQKGVEHKQKKKKVKKEKEHHTPGRRFAHKALEGSVSDPYSFDTDPDPAFYAEYRSGSGSNLGPGFHPNLRF